MVPLSTHFQLTFNGVCQIGVQTFVKKFAATCQVLNVTCGTVNATRQWPLSMLLSHCLNFNLVLIYVSLIQFGPYLCLFDSI